MLNVAERSTATVAARGAAFVLGWDTAVRLINPKYYDGERGRDACLRKLRDRGCVVVVGGRIDTGGEFRTWTGQGIADEFRDLFLPLGEEDFRVDVSSTELRKNEWPQKSTKGTK